MDDMDVKRILAVLFVPFLANCHTIHPTTPTSYQQIDSTVKDSIKSDSPHANRKMPYIPYNVNSALVPSLSSYVRPTSKKEPRFDVSANKIPAKEFYMGLVNGTDYN